MLTIQEKAWNIWKVKITLINILMLNLQSNQRQDDPRFKRVLKKKSLTKSQAMKRL